MPAEPTKAKLKRRSSRKEFDEYRFDSNHARELEMKRNRGEVSCAECRRLKIKCDKQIPCQSCQRRGCSALCPNGSLATGQGTRFVLAATEHLHRRIAKLSGRIRQLEDALAALQAKHSNEPHPLLQEDLLGHDERDEDGPGLRESAAGTTGHGTDVIDAFGTLSISDHGISRFFGPTGGSESLLLANLNSYNVSPNSPETPESLRDSASPCGPNDLSLFSQSFPFTPMGQTADVQELIESHLPVWERAHSLCEIFLGQVSWLFRSVTRAQLMDDMLPAIYRKEPSKPDEDYSGPHDLALLFIIFAIGALVQPEPSNALGEHYYQVSRAAISLQPVLEKPSIVTIQTLHLMSIYSAMSGGDLRSETSMEMSWSLITLASHLSQTIGLHRDSARWGLSPKMVQRRRIIFWDLFVADVWQSLNTGRPPSFSLAYIDCSFPTSEADSTSESAFQSSFGLWQCRFAAECVAEVTARTLTAEAPSYATIMELDRKVREFPLPEGYSSASNDFVGSFQRCVLDHIRETVLMYIHRSFFAQAIIDNPINPLKSTYSPSFLAAYRASSTILKSIREQFNVWPNSCCRFWVMWTFAFSAAVVFGTVVTRGPRSPLAQSAMSELEQALILFTKASKQSIRAAKALPILLKLSEKARNALALAQKDPAPSSDNGASWSIKQEDTEDELSIIAGRTRFISSQKLPSSTEMDSMNATQSYVTLPVHSTVSPLSYSTGTNVKPADSPASAAAPNMVSNWPNPLERQSSHCDREGYMTAGPFEERPPSLHYPYISSERTQLVDSSPYAYPMPLAQQVATPLYNHTEPPSVALSNRYSPQSQLSLQIPPPALPPMSSQRHVRHESQDQHHRLVHHAHDQNGQYIYQHDQCAHTPGFNPQHGPASSELADLGLASRDSRLDERWSSFMEDSGLLDGLNFRPQ